MTSEEAQRRDTRAEILHRVDTVQDLPAWPAILERLERAMSASDASLDEVAHIINEDAAVSAGVLRLANSAIFAGRFQVRSVVEAATRLGMRELRRVATAAVLVTRYHTVRGVRLNRHWLHSLAVAMCIEPIAELSEHEFSDDVLRDAWLAALLHDVGALLLRVLMGAQSEEVAELVNGGDGQQDEVQRLVWGVDYCEVGERLAERWKLPLFCQEAIRYHLDPPAEGVEFRQIVDLVHVANFVCVNRGYHRGDEGTQPLARDDVWASLGLEPAESVDALARIVRERGQMSESFVALLKL